MLRFERKDLQSTRKSVVEKFRETLKSIQRLSRITSQAVLNKQLKLTEMSATR